MTDPLANTKSMLIVFAMGSCPACHDYKPRFEKQVAGFQSYGCPLIYYKPGTAIAPHQIPVLIIDAASQDPSITAFADQYAISALPTTLMLTRYGKPIKLEGAISDDEIYQVLVAAVNASR